MLTPLQERIRRLVGALPNDYELALAGGGGLVVTGVIDRRTRDLDFFARYPAPHAEVVDRVQEALEADGLRVTRLEDESSFARLQVQSGDDSTTVDLGADYRLAVPLRTPSGAVLAVDDLAADKVLTLEARAEARDFVDFAALTERFTVGELCALAARKDAGFRASRLGRVLAAFENRAPGVYADFPVDYQHLRATIATAAEEIARLHQSPEAGL